MKFKIKKVPDGFVDNPLLAVRTVSNLNFILVSIDNLMTIWVCIVSGFLQKKFGPKKILMVACFPYFLAWLCVGFATSLTWIYISRLLVGISHAFVTTTVYTTEVSSRDMRGTFSMFESVLRYFMTQRSCPLSWNINLKLVFGFHLLQTINLN